MNLKLIWNILNIIKKSRFIARAQRVNSIDSIFLILDKQSDPKASHCCWAYKIGDQYRFNDDGEPAGTAGKPILNAIESLGLDHVLVWVIRYFGGIKLGAGGLTRAYGGSAALCLRSSAKIEIHPRTKLRLQIAFANIGRVYAVMERFKAEKTAEQYLPQGVALELVLEQSLLEAFTDQIRDACRNQVRFDIV